MAGAEGYRFIFLSVIFYSFLAFLMSVGLDEYLEATVPALETIDSANFLSSFITILSNPLTAYGFLSWFSIALLITNIYIIITSVIP